MTVPPAGKQESYSFAASLAVAIVALVVTLIAGGYVAGSVVVTVLESIPSLKGGGRVTWLYDLILVVGVLGIPLCLACGVSRWTYMALRWDDVQPGGRHCTSCGYDLTGNVTGRCPECGAAIRAEG